MRRVLLTILATTLLGACAAAPTTPNPPPTSAAPAPTTPVAAGPTPSAPSPVTLPPRPKPLPLDGVDPCSLITPAQRAALGLDGSVRPSTSTAPVFSGPSCYLAGFEPRAIGVNLIQVTGAGIGELTRPGGVSDQLTALSVAGFPAVLARPRHTDFCSVDVDVADGQFIDVHLRDAGGRFPIPQDQLCRDAHTVAEQVLHTMLTR